MMVTFVMVERVVEEAWEDVVEEGRWMHKC